MGSVTKPLTGLNHTGTGNHLPIIYKSKRKKFGLWLHIVARRRQLKKNVLICVDMITDHKAALSPNCTMPAPSVVVEVCIDSVAGAWMAEAAGADRVELCADLVEGGITPSWGLVQQAREVLVATKLYVLIRPRGGDFVYAADELQVMLADIRACKQLGAHGVVVGCLRPDGSVDTASTQQLVQEARSQDLDVTFHRAFDVSRDLSQALEDVISLGISRVLTSGGCPTAAEGASVLSELVKQAAGRISIMAGGGVRSANAAQLLTATGVRELHSSAKRRMVSSMTYRRPNMRLSATTAPDDFEWGVTDEAELGLLVATIKQAALLS